MARTELARIPRSVHFLAAERTAAHFEQVSVGRYAVRFTPQMLDVAAIECAAKTGHDLATAREYLRRALLAGDVPGFRLAKPRKPITLDDVREIALRPGTHVEGIRLLAALTEQAANDAANEVDEPIPPTVRSERLSSWPC